MQSFSQTVTSADRWVCVAPEQGSKTETHSSEEPGRGRMCERVTDKREGEGDGSNEVGRYSVSLLFSIEKTLFVPDARVCLFPLRQGRTPLEFSC